MKFKHEINLISGVLQDHDEMVDKAFPTDKKKVTAFAKAQYINLFGAMQEIAEAIETANNIFGKKDQALKIIVENMNSHSEMVNEIMEETNYKQWSKLDDKHYTGVFYHDLHTTVEEIIEELEEVK